MVSKVITSAIAEPWKPMNTKNFQTRSTNTLMITLSAMLPLAKTSGLSRMGMIQSMVIVPTVITISVVVVATA